VTGTGAPPRLTAARLGDLPPGTAPPARPDRIGVVHLGAGAFFRGHLAPFTEDAGDGWGTTAVAHASRATADALRAQDGLYTLLERGGGRTRAQVVGAISEVLVGADDPAAVRTRLADPGVSVVTVTATEAGYRHDPTTRRLRAHDPVLAAELAAPHAPPRTLVGRLVDGLAARFAAGSPAPLTVLVCDNVTDGGALLAGLVAEHCARSGRAALADRIAEHVRFPTTVVDRIVPPPGEGDRAEAARLLGVADAAAVGTEAHRLWVVADDFAGPRPAWERAGARLVPDVAPWVRAKLRLVNAPHTALALLGAPLGATATPGAMAHDELAGFVAGLLDAELVPTVPRAPGLDPAAVARTSLVRFADPGVPHPLAHIAADTSLKIGPRLLDPAVEHRAAGRDPVRAATVVAAWVHALRRDGGRAAPRDAHGDRLAAAAAGPDPVAAVLGQADLVPAAFAQDRELVATVAEALEVIERDGVPAVLRWAGGTG
jgi:fructuronate reductase